MLGQSQTPTAVFLLKVNCHQLNESLTELEAIMIFDDLRFICGNLLSVKRKNRYICYRLFFILTKNQKGNLSSYVSFFSAIFIAL